MFKRFDPSTSCSTSTPIKTSVQRAIKNQILTAHPNISEEDIEEIIPKKQPLIQYKAGQHAFLYCTRNPVTNSDEPIFFQDRDGPVMPTLKLVHRYPDLGWTVVKVDKGAIPFILGGANIMCPGLTNKGGDAGNGLKEGSGVVILAENKESAIAVGILKMSSDDM